MNALDRGVIKLERQNLSDDNCKMFLEQESEGIIERIDVSPDDFNKCIWVAHRSVIKRGPVCTTKIWPVFNYLITGGRQSLNDCVYPGVNLFTDTWDLLLKFRCHRFVLLKDIHKEIAKLSKGGIYVKFNYVNKNDNPVDLITRGVSLNKFKAQFLFWLHGPSWLIGKSYNVPLVSWAI